MSLELTKYTPYFINTQLVQRLGLSEVVELNGRPLKVALNEDEKVLECTMSTEGGLTDVKCSLSNDDAVDYARAFIDLGIKLSNALSHTSQYYIETVLLSLVDRVAHGGSTVVEGINREMVDELVGDGAEFVAYTPEYSTTYIENGITCIQGCLTKSILEMGVDGKRHLPVCHSVIIAGTYIFLNATLPYEHYVVRPNEDDPVMAALSTGELSFRSMGKAVVLSDNGVKCQYVYRGKNYEADVLGTVCKDDIKQEAVETV